MRSSLVVLLFLSCEGGSKATLSSRLQTVSAKANTQPLVGQSTLSSLASLQYAIREISICEQLVTSGSGYQQPQNCVLLFTRPIDPRFDGKDPTQDFSAMAALARSTTDNFIDLLDPTSRAALTTTTSLHASDAHAYNWGLITWDLPIKVRADIPMADGTTLHTHDGDTHSRPIVGGPVSGYAYQTVAATALDTGPAETATIMLPNGGTWFRFQHPLTVTADDVSAGAALALDLAFDPAGLVSAATDLGPSDAPLADSASRGISVPLLDISPVPHRATESVLRETWLAHVGASADQFDLRLELYRVADDPARTIYGVGLTGLLNTQSQHPAPQFPRVSFIGGTGDALDFEDWSHAPLISGFTPTSTAGASVTASLHCGGTAVFFAGCGADGRPATTPITFTLDSVSPL